MALADLVSMAVTQVRLRGAGATFPSLVYTGWINTYKALRQDHVAINATYMAVGSGTGKKLIMEELPSVEYAGSDSVVQEEDYQRHTDLQMYPVIAGSVLMLSVARLA